MTALTRFALSLAAALALTGAARAATVTEGTDFSSDWFNPTQIAAGTTTVTGAAGDLDVFQFNGLATGAQQLSFGFSGAGLYTSGNLTAGGHILYSATPFQWAWDNDGMLPYQISYTSWNVGTPWFGSSGSLTSSVTLQLGAAFAGTLYVAIVPWNSTPLSYTIGLPAVAAPPPPPDVPAAVPLPPAGAALLAGIGLTGLVARRRRLG